MADDVTVTTGNNATPPTGTIFATDQVGARHIPVVKIAVGTADSAAFWPGDTTNGQLVQVSGGTVILSGYTSGTASLPGTALAYSTASATALASNSGRLGYSIINHGTAVVTVSYASTATSTNYIERLGSQYSRVSDGGIGVYTGVITMIASAAGTAIVTEW